MAEIYIPPNGIYFRILGYVSQQVLFSRFPKPQVGQLSVNQEYPDQYFTLIHGTGARLGTYAIKSRETGYVLFSRGSEPYVGHIEGDGKYNDNWFKLEPGKGQYSKQFRLVTPSNGLAVFSRTNQPAYLANHPASQVYPDQHFTFLWEDMEIDKVEYDLNLGQVVTSTPIVIANQSLHNSSSQPQEMSFQLHESQTHTSTFEYSFGFTVTAGTTFKAGVPFLAEGKFSINFSISNQWTWGGSDSFTESYNATFPVKAGPGKTVRAVSTVNKGELAVPFTMFLHSKSTGVKAETKGTWRGVSTWDLRHTITED